MLPTYQSLDWELKPVSKKPLSRPNMLTPKPKKMVHRQHHAYSYTSFSIFYILYSCRSRRKAKRKWEIDKKKARKNLAKVQTSYFFIYL